MTFLWNEKQFLNYTSKNGSFLFLVEVAFKKVKIFTKLCIVEFDQKNICFIYFSALFQQFQQRGLLFGIICICYIEKIKIF